MDSPINKKSILIVEDDPVIISLINFMLKNMGYIVAGSASTAKDAIEAAQKLDPDLILMDIRMPVMSGLAAAEKIRALESAMNSHVPIIAITANAMIGDKEKCLSAGIDDYISKPYQPAALINKIKNML